MSNLKGLEFYEIAIELFSPPSFLIARIAIARILLKKT